MKALAMLAAMILVAREPTALQTPSSAVPQPLAQYLEHVVRPTALERSQLASGLPFTKLLDADESKEVAVFGIVWIDAPVSRYVAAVKDIESFERGGAFRITRKISSPPRLADFADLRLPDQDLTDLRSCRVGDCELKLGARPLEALRNEVDWNGPTPWITANNVVRRYLFEYVNGYLSGGNDRLAIYRDSTRPRFVAGELRSMIGGMPSLTDHWPGIRRYLLEFPRVRASRTAPHFSIGRRRSLVSNRPSASIMS